MTGIIIGLALLMILAFKGWSVLWAAPVAALVVALSGGLDPLYTYTVAYMDGFVGFTASWFPVFMLGAIFGKLMEFTGMARAIALKLSEMIGTDRAILAVIISCAVLTYGGISLFVVVFAIYPLALNLFREAGISRRILPAAIGLGSFTFTMTALPGSPQIQNLIPMPFFGTTATAAPIMGVTAAVIIAVLGYSYLIWRQRQLKAMGEVFIEPEEVVMPEGGENLPNAFISVLPLFLVIFSFNVLSLHIVAALALSNILILVLNYDKVREFVKAINEGAQGSVTAIMNTSAAVGFGAVVRNVPAFDDLAGILFDIPGNPLVSLAVTSTLLAGATGSASGGLGIALEALGPAYYHLAIDTGISPAAFHRIASLASGGLDSLPHNGALLTLFAITGMTHKESYKDLAITVIGSPIVAIAVVIVLASYGIY